MCIRDSSTGDGFELVKAVDANLAFMDVVRLNPSVHSENGVNSSCLLYTSRRAGTAFFENFSLK